MSKLLLLVEDEVLIQQLLDDALDEAGFELIVNQDGASAIAELEARADAFAALITDVNLGPGPTGWEVARHARSLRPSIPVVYMTGDSGHERGANGVPDSICIEKPFAPAQIVTAVSMLVNKSRA